MPDSAARDTIRRDSTTRLKAVTIVATPADRAEPTSATHVDAATIALTPSLTPYELLRQTSSVLARAISSGRRWKRTSLPGRTARITERGTTATPEPAAAQAMMA